MSARVDALRRLGRNRAFGPGRAWVSRLVELQAVDRAVALAALAFSSLVPLLIVYDAVVPTVDGRDFAAQLIERFHLSGSAAAALRDAMAGPSEVKDSVGVLGFALVVISALSFARGLQRLYAQAFRVEAARAAARLRATLLWIALIPVYITVRDAVDALVPGIWDVACSLALAAVLFTLTPLVLLGGHVPHSRLLATGAVTALAMSALGAAAGVWMDRSVSASTSRFGLLGIAFALFGFLVAAGFVLVGSAAAGAVATERRGPALRRPGPRG